MQDKISMIELQFCPVLNSIPPTKNVLHGRVQCQVSQQNFRRPFSYQGVRKLEITQVFCGTHWSWKATVNPNSSSGIVAFYCALEDPAGVTWWGCFELIPWEWRRRGSCDGAYTITIPQFSAKASQIMVCEKAGAIVASGTTWSCALCWPRGPRQHANCKNPTGAHVSGSHACWKQSALTTYS